jgi:hypothetical protein
MKTVLVSFALLLVVLSGTQAKNSKERIDPTTDTLELIIDIDETVRIDISSSPQSSSSLSVNTNIEEVVLKKEKQSTYIVTKVKKPANTATPRKATKTPEAKPTVPEDASVGTTNSPSVIAAFLSVIALALGPIFFGSTIGDNNKQRSYYIAICAVALLCGASLAPSFTTAANDKADSVVVLVILPDNINAFTITQNPGRKGLIDISGDSGAPIGVKSFRFTTSTNTELKRISVSACESFVVESSEGSIIVEDFLAPLIGLCNIDFKAGKRVFASFASGFLGSFNLECQQQNTKPCTSNGVGSAVKHSSNSQHSSSGIAINATAGDTLCSGDSGHNNLFASGNSVNVDFSSSADCPGVLTPQTSVIPSTAPAAPSASSLPTTCKMVNGIRWCHNPTKCGESCDEVCSHFGYSITISDSTWYNAQNDATKCQNIANAFGFTSINLDTWSYACLLDAPAAHPDPSKFVGALYCSTLSSCPSLHRTGTDQYGLPCSDANAKKSICPCQ